MTQTASKIGKVGDGGMRTGLDLAIIFALVGCVIAISAHAPSTTIAHAQGQQIAAVIGTVQTGEWLLPRDHAGRLARKPQLYAWVTAPVLSATGAYNDFTFRLPTVLASFVTGLLVYLLGRRWYGRSEGLIAACLWACIHHQAKMMYLAVTDMMLTMFVTASILCADRLLFHPAPVHRRKWWAIGLWGTMILAAMTKGWGVLNLGLVGGMLAMATVLWPGLSGVSSANGVAGKMTAVLRTVFKRWSGAIKATGFGWGMLAMACVLVPLWVAMFARGGQEFREIAYYEFWSRVTGSGKVVPHSSSVPPIVHLLYYMLPVTVFAAGAMVLAGPKRWCSGRGPLLLPLCWIISVVTPFSLMHGFRHDYLLPCYGAGALMGAWAVMEVCRLVRRGQRSGVVSGLRHAFAAAAIGASLLLVLAPLAIIFSEKAPAFVTKNLKVPALVEPETWVILALLIPLGVAAVVLAVRWSLTWQIRKVVAVALVAMLGVMFVERHVIMRQARTGDGERVMRFGRAARKAMGSDSFAKFRADKLLSELYIGRFAIPIMGGETGGYDKSGRLLINDLDAARDSAKKALAALGESQAKWLITSDKGLTHLGAAVADARGSYRLRIRGKRASFITQPELLGTVELASEPVVSQRWGRAYLIRLDRARLDGALAEQVYSRAVLTDFESGRQAGR